MKSYQNDRSSLKIFGRRFRPAMFVGLSVCLLFAFVLCACSTTGLSSSANAATMTNVSTASAASGYPVKVYFSKNPTSFSNSLAVFPVNRTSPTLAVATFAIQLLVAGPTLSERQAGYFTELNSMLSGPSNCSAPLPTGGPDFTLALNKRGTVPQTETATLKFCRDINSPGIGADARVTAEINATLEQFSNIKQVVILTEDGNCFNNELGNNACLK